MTCPLFHVTTAFQSSVPWNFGFLFGASPGCFDRKSFSLAQCVAPAERTFVWPFLSFLQYCKCRGGHRHGVPVATVISWSAGVVATGTLALPRQTNRADMRCCYAQPCGLARPPSCPPRSCSPAACNCAQDLQFLILRLRALQVWRWEGEPPSDSLPALALQRMRVIHPSLSKCLGVFFSLGIFYSSRKGPYCR